MTDARSTDTREHEQEPPRRPGARPGSGGAGAGWRRRSDALVVVIPALLAYVPLLFTAMGQVGADTKTYLYLDPGKLLSDAPYVWDSQIGLGTVTHQNIGYLWPMGPFYWVMDAVSIPDWVAQRLWLGTVLFAAGMGVRYLLRTVDAGGLARRRGGLLVAVLAYMLSPYLLDYSARISVLLLPWAALPWLIALTAQSLRAAGRSSADPSRGWRRLGDRWRYPALFALVVVTVGGINATALIMVGFGPLLWVVHAVWFAREVPLRKAVAACARIGVLTVATSLWWIAGLWAEGRYGLPVIRYTETYKTVASVSSAPEVLRGLGYWFFYGKDKLGPWVEPGVSYTEVIPTLALSYLLPIVALVAAALLRWKHRLFFILLLVVGTLLAVASYPFDTPSPVGSVFKAFTRTDTGLSLRSTPRAAPLVILATAVFLGAGVSAVGKRLPKYALGVTGLVCLLVVANLPTLWTGDMVASNLKRSEDIPQYWNETAAYLDAQSHDTRILEVPGSDFASYRWGNTVDPITPGLTDRPYVARELFVWGAPASANLLNAYDRRFHEDTMDAAAISPIAQVMAAGDLVLRADLQYERFRTARPRDMWRLLNAAPGLDAPIAFGPTDPNVAIPELPLIDEIELAAGHPTENPPAVSVFGVQNPFPILRTHAAERPLLVAGDGDGLVDAASLGILTARQASFYAASYPTAADGGFSTVYDQGADLLVSDTNRKRARRWGTLRETTGYTERAGEKPLVWDPNDQRLELFPGAGDDAYTVTEQIGGATVTATSYGNPVTFTPNDRAVNALDGDLATAWRAGDGGDPRGETLFIDLAQPVTTDHVTLVQPTNGPRNRWITTAELTLTHPDGTTTTTEVELDDQSRTDAGQVVSFPSQTITDLDIEITGTDLGVRPRYYGLSSVGFAEVRIDGVTVEELVRPPTDLLDRAGASSLDHRLSLLFTRLRSNPLEPVRTDEELAMRRLVTLPVARSYALTGQARLSTYAREATVVDLLLGTTPSNGVTAVSDLRLPGSIADGGRWAIDGDPTTSWTTPFSVTTGADLTVTTPGPVTIDHLDLQLVTDGHHSVPSRLSLVVDGDEAHAVPIDLAGIGTEATPTGTTTVPVQLPAAVTGSQFRFTVDEATELSTIDWYAGGAVKLPIGIAELGLPGVTASPLPATFDSGCRTDLLTVDGRPVALQVTGTTEAALRREALAVSTCGADAAGVGLDAGDHVIRTAEGLDLGIDIDRLLLGSEAGGAALPLAEHRADVPPEGPPVTVTDQGRVSYDARVEAGGEPFWLALGQSQSEGWEATADGVSLGAPQLIDGYGNGWLVTPDDDGPVRIHLEWTPQRLVWIGIGISVVAALVCLVLAFLGRPRPDDEADVEPDGDPEGEDPEGEDLSIDLPNRVGPVVAPRATVTTALVLAAFAFLTIPFTSWWPLVSLGVLGAVLVAFRAPRGRGWLGLGAAASLALAALYIVTGQLRHRYRADFDWPIQYGKVHILGLLALYLLLAEGLRAFLARPDRPDRDDHPDRPDLDEPDDVSPASHAPAPSSIGGLYGRA